jgi:hypothetical protein
MERSNGRFVSRAGFRRLHGLAGSPYELLIFDQGWKPVSHLNEWYRLHGEQIGRGRTRDTYLDMPLPFMGFLLHKDYSLGRRTGRREYTRIQMRISAPGVRNQRR